MVEAYDKRRRFIVDALNRIDGVTCAMPKGAFYVFPDVSNLGISSSEFCSRLLDEEGVSTTPGSVFGECGEGYIRVSYATSFETLADAIGGIKGFIDRYS
jgi:aminotransferase